ncbi:hypothetical protein ESB00_11055 [Oleiharenicola lentus]|uniref:Uncharacterized protein n=1 Tax=Oleiharenicola lentus TaxID=2508720 RepID=A0A4Q1CB98_9BACT|nr:hypothetical protein ESB00_11055 [Oleiharenicola lentus]
MACFALLLAGRLPAQPPPPPRLLFLGSTLELSRDGNRFAALVGADENQVRVRTDDGLATWKLDSIRTVRQQRELQFGVEELKVENTVALRCYSPKADPRTRWAEVQDMLLSAQAVQQQMQQMEESGALANQDDEIGFASSALRGTGQSAMAASASASSLLANVRSGAASAGPADLSIAEQEYEKALAEEKYDAIKLDFSVSSPVSVSDVYVVLFVEYQAADAEETQQQVVVKSLGDLGSTPRRVTIRRGGLPPGYLLKATRIHFYTGGEEMPSSLSDRRMEIDEEKAFTYLLVQRRLKFPDGTHKPAIMWRDPRPVQLAGLSAGEWDRKRRFVVDANGRLSLEAGDPQEAYAELLAEVRYYPALRNGEPVRAVLDGTLRLVLGEP